MKDYYPDEQPVAAANLDKDNEQLPTKPVEQVRLTAYQNNETNVPAGGFDSHEGLIALRTERGKVQIAADTDTMRAKLQAEGYTETGGGVPYTGVNGGDRYDPNVAGKLTGQIAANLAAIDRNLQVTDYENLNDEQKAELKSLDIGYVDAMFGSKGALMVSRGDSINPHTEEGLARLAQVGTFAKVQVPFTNNPKKGYEGVAVTDQFGNQFLAPDCEALSEYLAACNFTETGEAFVYDPGDVSKPTRAGYNLSQSVIMRSLRNYDADPARQARHDRVKTTLVEIEPALAA